MRLFQKNSTYLARNNQELHSSTAGISWAVEAHMCDVRVTDSIQRTGCLNPENPGVRIPSVRVKLYLSCTGRRTPGALRRIYSNQRWTRGGESRSSMSNLQFKPRVDVLQQAKRDVEAVEQVASGQQNAP